jgi:hypothetical protein
MIANNLTPYEPVHPGEVLKEERVRARLAPKKKLYICKEI